MKNALSRSSPEASDQLVRGGTTSYEKIRLDSLSLIKSGDGSIISLILRDKNRKEDVDIPDTGRFSFVLDGHISLKYAWG